MRAFKTIAVWIAGSVCALCPVLAGRAATTINVGNFSLLPNTAGQVIQIPISGGDLAPGADLAVQVGDGGPELASLGLAAGTPGPTISQINFGGASIFAVTGAQQSTPAGNLPQVWFTSVFLTGSPSHVSTSGILANVTVDTTNFSSGAFALSLANVLSGLAPPNGYSTDLTSEVANLTITNGTITIIPAVAYWRGSASGNWSTSSGGVTNWRTDAGGSTDTHAAPGVASDVYFVTTSSATNLATTLDADFSIKGLNFTAAATSSVSISGTHTLTIGVDGLSLQNGAAAATINSAVTLGASQTWSVAGANPLTANGAVNIGGTTLTKAGAGTLTLHGPLSLASSGRLTVDAGTTVLSAASAPTIASGAQAKISPGATLMLAGSISDLSSGSSRADIFNDSLAASGGLLVSGNNQRVGGIDGAGLTVIADGGSLIADHLRQSSLMIGVSSTLTLAPSDSLGHSLQAPGAGELSLLPAAGSLSVVPEPRSIALCIVGAAGAAAFAQAKKRGQARGR